jgi:excisionase family DNA binding protein
MARSQLLDTAGAAAYLGVSPDTMNRWRSIGGGPVYAKVGRQVRYSLSDLDAWVEQRKRRSTSDQGQEVSAPC